jgi:hypothetical protein
MRVRMGHYPQFMDELVTTMKTNEKKVRLRRCQWVDGQDWWLAAEATALVTRSLDVDLCQTLMHSLHDRSSLNNAVRNLHPPRDSTSTIASEEPFRRSTVYKLGCRLGWCYIRGLFPSHPPYPGRGTGGVGAVSPA